MRTDKLRAIIAAGMVFTMLLGMGTAAAAEMPEGAGEAPAIQRQGPEELEVKEQLLGIAPHVKLLEDEIAAGEKSEGSLSVGLSTGATLRGLAFLLEAEGGLALGAPGAAGQGVTFSNPEGRLDALLIEIEEMTASGTSVSLANFRYWFEEGATLDGQTGTVRLVQVTMDGVTATAEEYKARYEHAEPGTIQLQAGVTARANAPWRLNDTGHAAPATGEAYTLAAAANGQRLELPGTGAGDAVATPVNFTLGAQPVMESNKLQAEKLEIAYTVTFGEAYDLTGYAALAEAQGNEGWLTDWAALMTVQRLDDGNGAWRVRPVLDIDSRTLILELVVEGQALEGFSAAVHLTALPLVTPISGEETAIAETQAEYHITGRYTGGLVTYGDGRQTALENSSEAVRRFIKNKDNGGEDGRLHAYLGGIAKEAVLWTFDATSTGSTAYGFAHDGIEEAIGRHFITRPTAGLEGDAAPDRIWFRLRLPQNDSGLEIDTLVLEDTGYNAGEMAPVGFLPPALEGSGITGAVEALTDTGWMPVWQDGTLLGTELFEAVGNVAGVPRPAGEGDKNVYTLKNGVAALPLRVVLNGVPLGYSFTEEALPLILFQLAEGYEEQGRVYFENRVAVSVKANDYALGTVTAEGQVWTTVPYYYETLRGLNVVKTVENVTRRGLEPGPGDTLRYTVEVSLPNDVLYMRDFTLYDTVGGVLELDPELTATMRLEHSNGSTIRPLHGEETPHGATGVRAFKNIRPVFTEYEGKPLGDRTMAFPFVGVLRQGDSFTLTYELTVPVDATPGSIVSNKIEHEWGYDGNEQKVRDKLYFADLYVEMQDRQGNAIPRYQEIQRTDAGTPFSIRAVAGLIGSELAPLDSPGWRLFLREKGWLDGVGVRDVRLYDIDKDTYELIGDGVPLDAEVLVTYFTDSYDVIEGWEEDPTLLDEARYLRVEFPGYPLGNWQAIGFSVDMLGGQVEEDLEFAFNTSFFGGEENGTYPVARLASARVWSGTANAMDAQKNKPHAEMVVTRSSAEKLRYPDHIYQVNAVGLLILSTTDRQPTLRKAANGKNETATLLPGETVEYTVTLTNPEISEKGRGTYPIWVEALADILPPEQQLVDGSAALGITGGAEIPFTLYEHTLADGRVRLLVVPDETVELEKDRRLVLTYKAAYLPEGEWQSGPVATMEENLASVYLELPDGWRLIPERGATVAWGRDDEASPAARRAWRDFEELDLEEELRIEASRPVVHRAGGIEPGVMVQRVSDEPLPDVDILGNTVNGLLLDWQVQAVNGAGARAAIEAYDLVVQLPVGFRYEEGSAAGEQPRVEVNQHGQQVLIWQGGEGLALPALGVNKRTEVRFTTLVSGDRAGGHEIEAYLLPRGVAFDAGDIPAGWGSYKMADELRALGVFTSSNGKDYTAYGRAVAVNYNVVLYDHLGLVSGVAVGENGGHTAAVRRGEEVYFDFTLQSVHGSKKYSDITIYHNLPAEGDMYSFISAARGSAFGLLLEGGFELAVEDENGGVTTLQPEEYEVLFSPQTANGIAAWDSMKDSFVPAAQWAAGVQPGSFKIVLGRELAPRETLRLRWQMRVPEGLPTEVAESWAWASAGYTLRLAGEDTRYTAEPVRAGVQLQREEDLSLTVEKQLLDEDGGALTAGEDLAFTLELRRWQDDAWEPVALRAAQVAGAKVLDGKLVLTVREGQSGTAATVNGLPEGTYSVLETVDTTLWAPAYLPEQVRLVPGLLEPLVVTNTPVPPEAATLYLTKSVEGSEAGGSFAIRLLREEEGNWQPVTLAGSVTVNGAQVTDNAVVFELAADGSRMATIDGLPAGNYRVEEDGPGLGWQVEYSDPRTIALPAGGTGEALVRNTWEAPTTELVLTKAVEGSTGGGAFAIRVERKEGDGWTFVELDGSAVTGDGVVEDGMVLFRFDGDGEQTATIHGLAEGTYRAEEAAPGEEWLVSYAQPEGVALVAGGTAALQVRNLWQGPDSGTLKVTKTLAESTAGGSFTLYIEKLEAAGWREIDLNKEDVVLTEHVEVTPTGRLLYSFAGDGSATAVIEGLASGTYRVQEEDPGMGFAVAYGPETVQLVRGGEAALGVTNTELAAALRIRKTLVTGTGESGEGQAFTFQLQRLEAGEWQEVSLAGLAVDGETATVDENGCLLLVTGPEGQAQALINGLLPGTYRVRELEADRYDVTVEPGSLVLAAGTVGEIHVTNAPKEDGSSSGSSSSEATTTSGPSSSEVTTTTSVPSTTSGSSSSEATTTSGPSSSEVTTTTSVPSTTSGSSSSEATTTSGPSSSEVTTSTSVPSTTSGSSSSEATTTSGPSSSEVTTTTSVPSTTSGSSSSEATTTSGPSSSEVTTTTSVPSTTSGSSSSEATTTSGPSSSEVTTTTSVPSTTSGSSSSEATTTSGPSSSEVTTSTSVPSTTSGSSSSEATTTSGPSSSEVTTSTSVPSTTSGSSSSEATTTSGPSSSEVTTTTSVPSTTSGSSSSEATTTSGPSSSEVTTTTSVPSTTSGSSSVVTTTSLVTGSSSGGVSSSGSSSGQVSSSVPLTSSDSSRPESGSEPEPPPVVPPSSSTSRPPVRSSTTSRAQSSTTSVVSSRPETTTSAPGEPGPGEGGESAPPPASSVVGGGTGEASSSGRDSTSRLTREQLIEETGSVRLFGFDMPLGNLRVGAAWSLVNLMLSVLAIFCGFVLVITAMARRSREKVPTGAATDEWEDDAPQTAEQTTRFGQGKRRVLAAVAGLVPLILFLIWEDLLTPVVLVNRWTPWIFAAWLVHFGLLLFSLIRRKVQEDEEPEEETV